MFLGFQLRCLSCLQGAETPCKLAWESLAPWSWCPAGSWGLFSCPNQRSAPQEGLGWSFRAQTWRRGYADEMKDAVTAALFLALPALHHLWYSCNITCHSTRAPCQPIGWLGARATHPYCFLEASTSPPWLQKQLRTAALLTCVQGLSGVNLDLPFWGHLKTENWT